jgi:hypothetical protein
VKKTIALLSDADRQVGHHAVGKQLSRRRSSITICCVLDRTLLGSVEVADDSAIKPL